MTTRNYSDTATPTTLTAGIDNAAVSLPVVNSAGYPTPPFTLGLDRGTVNQEVCLVTATPDGTHFTVQRGYDGTTAVGHSTGATVEHCSIALDFREANLHINDATRDDHTQYMKASGTRHDSSARHAVGTVIAVGTPGESIPGDTAVQGVAVSVAASDHQHERETLAELLNWLIPVGVIMPYAVPIGGGHPTPDGFLICNGQAVSRSTYPNLYSAIGNLYGAGDGSTTFNLPNLVERVIIGSLPPGQNPGPDAIGNNYTMGTYGGELWHTLTTAQMPTHAHGVSDPGHYHNSFGDNFMLARAGSGVQFPSGSGYIISLAGNVATGYTGITIQASGGGQAHNIVSPYLTLHMLIKADQ